MPGVFTKYRTLRFLIWLVSCVARLTLQKNRMNIISRLTNKRLFICLQNYLFLHLPWKPIHLKESWIHQEAAQQPVPSQSFVVRNLQTLELYLTWPLWTRKTPKVPETSSWCLLGLREVLPWLKISMTCTPFHKRPLQWLIQHNPKINHGLHQSLDIPWQKILEFKRHQGPQKPKP